MIAFECIDDTHEDAQFKAETRRELVKKVRHHFGQFHPEVSQGDVAEIVDASAYDPNVRARTLSRLARSTEGGSWAETELVEAATPR